MALRHVVLAVLAHGNMSGYEITKKFESVYSHIWQASHQQVYRELAGLSAEGHVSANVMVQRGRPDKKIYTISKTGLAELRQWILAPTEFPRPQYDLLVKLLACDVVGRKSFRTELERVRKIAEEWLRNLRAMQRVCNRQRAKGWSEHDQVLYLALRRGLLLGEAQVQWLEEVDEYLVRGALPG